MKILVTGAAGFIGSHLSEHLLQNGHELTGIDNFDPFYPEEIKKKNIAVCLKSPGYKFIRCSLDELATKVNPSEANPDVVVHLAAKAGVRPSIENPQAYLETNVNGTMQLLEWMRAGGIKRMVFASSSSVYGNNKKTPFSESDNVDYPISPYAFTKKSCELMNYNYHHLYDISIINLRFFTVYGPRQRPDLAIHKFFELIYNNQPIPIFGDGSTGRDYTFIDDTIQGVIKSIERICKAGNSLFETINLGNSKPVLLTDLVRSIEEVTGKKAILNHLPMQDGDVERTFADISLARKLLGYNPQVNLPDGLSQFRNWYESK